MSDDVDLVIVAGAGDGDIAARIVDIERSLDGKSLGDSLVALVLVAHELVDIFLVQVEVVGEEAATAVVDALEDDTAARP